jgi:hypothetical protein
MITAVPYRAARLPTIGLRTTRRHEPLIPARIAVHDLLPASSSMQRKSGSEDEVEIDLHVAEKGRILLLDFIVNLEPEAV